MIKTEVYKPSTATPDTVMRKFAPWQEIEINASHFFYGKKTQSKYLRTNYLHSKNYTPKIIIINHIKRKTN